MKKTTFIILILVAYIISGCASVEHDWEKTQNINTIDGYEKFLLKHPDSKFSNEANRQIENLDWEATQKRNTVLAYQRFIKEYPQSLYFEEAKNRIENLHWIAAKLQDTVQSLRGFIQKYPNSINVEEAQKRIKILEDFEEQVKQTKNIEELRQLLGSLPISIASRSIPIIEDDIVSRIKQGIQPGYSIPLYISTRITIWKGVIDQSEENLIAARATLTSSEIVRETPKDIIPPTYQVSIPLDSPTTYQTSPYISLTLTNAIRPRNFFGYNSIIRFDGQMTLQNLSKYLKISKPSNLQSLVFYGDGDPQNRLTFFVSPDKGLIYVRGKGRVLHNGKEMKFGY